MPATTTPLKVALLGADGNLGPAILTALLSHNISVTVLKRASSRSPDSYPPGVTVAQISDTFPVDEVTPHLQHHTALIVTIKGADVALQLRLAEACIAAGVSRFIPADFGSCDSSSAWAQELVPLFKRKTEFREELQRLAEANPAFSWTSLVNGHFFDWSLEFLHVYLRNRRADVLDDGNKKWSASTLSRVGEATARIILNLEETKNRMIYIQSFLVSQNEVIAAFERATGGGKFDVRALEAKAYEKEKKVKADDGDKEAVEDLVWLLGALDADWTGKEGFAMEMLGLEDEDLEETVKAIVEREGEGGGEGEGEGVGG